jgi:chromate transporter
LTAALSAVTAAVVGVVLNLAVWFAVHAFSPSPGVIDGLMVILSAAAFIALTRFKLVVVTVVLAGGVIGLARHFI